MRSLHDVAQRAGVSAATVSRVLSGSPYPVRAETRERVLRSAKVLDFHPNMVARALVTARTRTIGAIVHDVSDPYFGAILKGLEDITRSHGYQLVVCSSRREADRELAYVQTLRAYRVDAIVFAGGGLEHRDYQTKLRSLLKSFESEGGVVVTLAPHVYRAASIVADNRGGAAAMTRHLVDLGHRRIGFVAGPPQLRTSRARLDGHRTALARSGIVWAPDRVVPGGFTTEGGALAAAELCGRRPEVTAIFAANDVMAFGVLHELARRGIRVPQEVSVAGFGDVPLAGYTYPPLTTVSVPIYEMGREGARMALDLLERKSVRSRRLPATVVARGSTGPPPGPGR